MATPEQITKRLQQIIKSKDDLEKFTADWGGGTATNVGWKAEELIPKNIERIVTAAIGNGHLNELGRRVGFPSDEHAAFTRNVWTDRRSWAAFVVSFLALIASIVALIKTSQ